MSSSHSKMLFIFSVVIIVAAIVIYFGLIPQQKPIQSAANIKIDGVFLPQAKEIIDFQLTDNHGKPFTKENLKGHWTMLFFGFTNCGMVCPTTMAALNKMYLTLEKELPENQLPHVVMISVDPERDSVKRMNEYVTAFNSHFIGARGDMAVTEALEKQLSIAAVKMQAEGTGKNHYSINHSAEILLFNPDAKLQAYLAYPHLPEQMVKDYKLIVG